MAQLDDVYLGIVAIALLGITGTVAMVYALMNDVPDINVISSYALAIGGLIAALVRGRTPS